MSVGAAGRLIALDPSKRASGWAYFEGGLLAKAGVARTARGDSDLAVVLALAADLTRADIFPGSAHMAAEWPQVYIGAQSKGDPNDLLWLTAVLGAAVVEMNPISLRLYRPAEWKGQVKKEAHNLRVLGRLTVPELAIVDGLDVMASLRHNAIDAIGIGLKHLGRLEAKRGAIAVDPAFKVMRLGPSRGRT